MRAQRWALAMIGIFFLGLPAMSGAESAELTEKDIQLSARLSKQSILLGEEFSLTLNITTPSANPVTAVLTNVPTKPFEVKSSQLLSSKKVNDSQENTFLLVMTAFELGRFGNVPIIFEYKDAGQKKRGVLSLDAELTVEPMKTGPKPGDTIKPIKGAYSVSLNFIRQWLIGLIVFALCVFLAVRLFLFWRRKNRVDESLLPADKRFALELQRLQQESLIYQERYSDHYKGLSDCLKRFMLRRFQIDLFDKTTPELLDILKQSPDFTSEDKQLIRDFLESSDKAKFARFEPAKKNIEAHEESLMAWVSKHALDATTQKQKTNLFSRRARSA